MFEKFMHEITAPYENLLESILRPVFELIKPFLIVLVPLLIVRAIIISILMFFARIRVKKNPTEKNAMRVYRLLRIPLGVTITNHPDEWAKYRDMFYIINGSSQVPSELKERIKTRLSKKGLYIQNMRIKDNYTPPSSAVNNQPDDK